MNFILNKGNKNWSCSLQLYSVHRCLSTKRTKKNPYETLGIAPQAAQKDIKNAYYKLSKQFHPDVNQTKEAAIRFQDITSAYEQIGTEESRSRYDRDTSRFVASGGMRRTASMMAATKEPRRESVESGDDPTQFFRERRKQQHEPKSNFFNAKKLSAVEAWKQEQEKRRKEKEQGKEQSFDFGFSAEDEVDGNEPQPKHPHIKRPFVVFQEPDTVDGLPNGSTATDNQFGSFSAILFFGIFIFTVGCLIAPDMTYQRQNYDVVLKKFSNSQEK